MLGTQIFHNSSMLSCLGILSNPLEIWENPVEALLSTQRLRKQIWEGSRVCFIDLCSRFFEQCVCGSGDQSWADLFMKRLSLEEGRDIYQNYKCRIGFLRSMYIGVGGISGPSWDFLNLTPPGNHLYLCSNSQLHLAGMGGAPQECPFLTSLQEIPALLRLSL